MIIWIVYGIVERLGRLWVRLVRMLLVEQAVADNI
jgi:hypothetical protein